MKTFPTIYKKTKVFALVCVFITLALTFGYYFSTTDDVSHSVDEDLMVDLTDYYDWNLSTSPFTKKIRKFVMEPLIEQLEDGPNVNRLVRNIKAKPDTTDYIVSLRQAVYWSDKRNLTSANVLGAYRRAKETCSVSKKCPDVWMKWFRKVELKSIDEYSFETIGIESYSQLISFLMNDFLIPIREDLLHKGPDAWKISLGPYLLKDVYTHKISRDSKIVLEPNPLYFRNVKKNPLTLSVFDEPKH